MIDWRGRILWWDTVGFYKKWLTFNPHYTPAACIAILLNAIEMGSAGIRLPIPMGPRGVYSVAKFQDGGQVTE